MPGSDARSRAWPRTAPCITSLNCRHCAEARRERDIRDSQVRVLQQHARGLGPSGPGQLAGGGSQFGDERAVQVPVGDMQLTRQRRRCRLRQPHPSRSVARPAPPDRCGDPSRANRAASPAGTADTRADPTPPPLPRSDRTARCVDVVCAPDTPAGSRCPSSRHRRRTARRTGASRASQRPIAQVLVQRHAISVRDAAGMT